MLANVLKHSLIAAAIVAAYAHAQTVDQNAGYLASGDGLPVRSADGDCWRTAAWTEKSASPECHPAPKPAFAAVNYATQVLFAFDDDALSADARKQLDELAQKLLNVEIDKVVAVGHSDAVGGEQYNKRLSARRAKAVGDYLAGKGVSPERLQLVAMGDNDSITAGACDSLTGEGPRDAKRVACLQPDRRVNVELVARQKQAAR
jgi:OmpA-OmpF porin, OOP family